jgi:hypothetical protein
MPWVVSGMVMNTQPPSDCVTAIPMENQANSRKECLMQYPAYKHVHVHSGHRVPSYTREREREREREGGGEGEREKSM